MNPNWNDTEQAIYKAWKKGYFDKDGVNNTCEAIGKDVGASMNSVKSIYARMKKYGAFPQPKKKYIQVSFRMSEDMHKALKQKSYNTGKSLNTLITRGVKRILR